MRPVWLEQSERGGEREEERPGRGQGRSCRAGGRIWIFTPRRSVGRGGLGPDSDAHEHPLRSLLQVGQMGWGRGAVKMRVPSLGREDPLEKEMATLSSIIAWKIHGQRSTVAII